MVTPGSPLTRSLIEGNGVESSLVIDRGDEAVGWWGWQVW
jgi:hypothetical protein